MTTVLADPGVLRTRLRDAGFTVVDQQHDRPDVVLADFRERATVVFGAPVLAWVDAGSLPAAIRSGARGFLEEEVSAGTLRRAVLTVAAGGMFFGPGLLAAAVEATWCGLTEREEEILRLLAAGRSTADLAQHLELAPKTVRNHFAAIGGKLGLRGQAELTAFARGALPGRHALMDTGAGTGNRRTEPTTRRA
ncbi:response regulator transcription factor [Amycolatopsis sp. NPDC059021]|uniref:helix-turn-helix transcriptional regulator n=1 Tax=Amycolatopsis sp. NPDC059021 TaxID=3346704 RepID=UPI00366E46FF